MLLSPAVCHDRLKALLAEDGPHTALLATPNGQLVSHVKAERPEKASDDNDEPWLDEPERIRLLLGLLSQWEEPESPRIECELGKLFPAFRPIAPNLTFHPSGQRAFFCALAFIGTQSYKFRYLIDSLL